MNPWVCPKCGRVWNGIVMECRPCNGKLVAFQPPLRIPLPQARA